MLAMFGLPGGWEWMLILIIGLLLFGRRLPEVGRSLGRSIVEFKKGVKGIEDEVNEASSLRTPEKLESGSTPTSTPDSEPRTVSRENSGPAASP